MADRQNLIRMAGYARISREDRERPVESESVQNQKALLAEYARERGWQLVEIYCDEDYSGVDSLRPDFNRLIADAEKHRFDVVVCKSQSRFTRDMEVVEQFIHNKFLLWGIRFISIADNGDTWMKGNKKARQIHGLINEWYLEDLSENVRMVLDYKRKSGQFIGAFASYGYRKNPQDHGALLPDPVAAQVVRQIYSLYLQGMGKTQIAGWLNARKIASPAAYKAQCHPTYIPPGEPATTALWNRTTVGRILSDPVYTGDLVQGKKKKLSYKSRHTATVPREEWIVVKGTHAPIIDQALFQAAQIIRQQRTRPSTEGIAHPLSGKVRCTDCGSAMNKYQTSYKGSRRAYLRCKRYGQDHSQCTAHSIRLDRLEEEIARKIRECIAGSGLTPESLIKHLPQGGGGGWEGDRREAAALHSEVTRRKTALRGLYLDRAEGIITGAQFEEFSREYQREITRWEERIQALEESVQQGKDSGSSQRYIRLAKEWLAVPAITRALVCALVDRVEVGERDTATGAQKIHIHWRF